MLFLGFWESLQGCCCFAEGRACKAHVAEGEVIKVARGACALSGKQLSYSCTYSWTEAMPVLEVYRLHRAGSSQSPPAALPHACKPRVLPVLAHMLLRRVRHKQAFSLF